MISILSLLLSNAVTLRRDISILYFLYKKYKTQGIGLDGGLLHITNTNFVLKNFFSALKIITYVLYIKIIPFFFKISYLIIIMYCSGFFDFSLLGYDLFKIDVISNLGLNGCIVILISACAILAF